MNTLTASEQQLHQVTAELDTIRALYLSGHDTTLSLLVTLGKKQRELREQARADAESALYYARMAG